MSELISAPGIYKDFDVASYYRDPMPAPSLTQSVAKILLEKSPLHAWTAHPRLNPDFTPDDDTKFDIGNICHMLLIGRGKDIVVLDEEFRDWRTKAAQTQRDLAAQAGKLAVLSKHYWRAQHMVEAVKQQLEFRRLDHLFLGGDGTGETVIAWQEGDLWFRQLIDWLSSDYLIFADFKSTDMSVAPHALGRMMVNAGWDIQAAMAERGLNELDGYKSRRFLFIVQETEKPYCLSVVELSESVLTMGRKKLQAAVNLWRLCMERNRWPGYAAEIVVPEYPSWAEAAWLTREETEFAT